ncbi:MAG: NADH-quinone oxidoreductase subunit L, partial [Ignavibacteriaceae bacterium]
ITSEFTWINLGNTPIMGEIKINLGILIDNISTLMMVVVMLISFLVHIFSIEYMRGDPRYNRYFASLGLFTFSMSGIVLTHNILMMYIFWELVGVSSYLLIGFWFEKKSAADAGKKAFIVNRIGDIGMFIGILILFTTYHTFTFDDIFQQISQGHLPFDSGFWLTITGLLIFAGAIGKSAQVPLHVWLPDAMEGPTPVSALIHAATMVAAGVYLVVRIFGILTADAMLIIAIIGALSAFIPATIALTQNDIKRVLAYSTVSQLGYMIMALGVGAFKFAFFHLITHAFFKACLFLGSGSVIHAMHHEQDIRNMGGLRKKMPVTYYTFLIASVAISGVPLTSGFLSKDGILAGSYVPRRAER